MRKYRTPKDQRATYVYYDENNQPLMELRPGENGVTEADIARLHREDDDEINNNERQTRKGRQLAPNGVVSYEAIDEDRVWIGGVESDPLELVLEDEKRRELREAVAKLPPKQAAAVTAVYFNDIAARQYAKSLGFDESTVSKLLKRALANLRRILGE